MNLKWIVEHFDQSQIMVLIFAVIFGFWQLRKNQKQSQFRVREADRRDLNRLKNASSLADAKLIHTPSKPKTPPLALPGIRLQGEPHEILGISATANEMEIMRAYKDAMKQYHPDRIQGQALEQIQFYQEAASKINQAKETMLLKFRK